MKPVYITFNTFFHIKPQNVQHQFIKFPFTGNICMLAGRSIHGPLFSNVFELRKTYKDLRESTKTDQPAGKMVFLSVAQKFEQKLKFKNNQIVHFFNFQRNDPA